MAEGDEKKPAQLTDPAVIAAIRQYLQMGDDTLQHTTLQYVINANGGKRPRTHQEWQKALSRFGEFTAVIDPFSLATKPTSVDKNMVRILYVMTGKKSEPPAANIANLRDRLAIGVIGPENGFVEAVTYNIAPLEDRFSFIKDRDGATQRTVATLMQPKRADCTSCHQNEALIFPERDWPNYLNNPYVAKLFLEANFPDDPRTKEIIPLIDTFVKEGRMNTPGVTPSHERGPFMLKIAKIAGLGTDNPMRFEGISLPEQFLTDFVGDLTVATATFGEQVLLKTYLSNITNVSDRSAFTSSLVKQGIAAALSDKLSLGEDFSKPYAGAVKAFKPDPADEVRIKGIQIVNGTLQPVNPFEKEGIAEQFDVITVGPHTEENMRKYNEKSHEGKRPKIEPLLIPTSGPPAFFEPPEPLADVRAKDGRVLDDTVIPVNGLSKKDIELIHQKLFSGIAFIDPFGKQGAALAREAIRQILDGTDGQPDRISMLSSGGHYPNRDEIMHALLDGIQQWGKKRGVEIPVSEDEYIDPHARMPQKNLEKPKVAEKAKPEAPRPEVRITGAVTKYCIDCHHPPTKDKEPTGGELPLSPEAWNALTAAEWVEMRDKMLTALDQNRMPPKKAPQMSAGVKADLRAWIDEPPPAEGPGKKPKKALPLIDNSKPASR